VRTFDSSPVIASSGADRYLLEDASIRKVAGDEG